MRPDGEGSVTRWLHDLKDGDPEAAREVWNRYFAGLVRLARARLRAVPRGVADEEDVALSAFDSFFEGMGRGRFPLLDDRRDLWRVLVTITARKAARQARDQRRRKRGGGRVLGEAALNGPDPDRDARALALIAGPEPTPEFAAMVAEELGRRLDALRDETLRTVAVRKMEGHTNEEIATALGLGLRTVERKLDLIRKAWAAEAPP